MATEAISRRKNAVKYQDEDASGVIVIWSLWRHCLCRFGFYPLIVTPFVFIACLLSLYSTADCEFLQVDVGFAPSNDAWESTDSNVMVGLWYYQSGEEFDLPWNRTYVEGCREYSSKFEGYFVQNDRVWNAARVSSLVGGLAGATALLTSFLLTVCPLPVCFIWPGVLLPSVIVAMCAEATKFLFFDTDICKSRIWVPSTNGSTLRAARGCLLQRGALVSLASIGVYFFCVVLICFRSPQKRHLDLEYGSTTTISKGEDKYHDLQRQDTLVLSEKDEFEQQVRLDEELGITHNAITPQIANMQYAERNEREQNIGIDAGETPRVGNSSSKRDFDSLPRDDISSLNNSFSFETDDEKKWAESAATSREEGEPKRTGALYALKKKREQNMKHERQAKSSRRIRKKLLPHITNSNNSNETALVVFNPPKKNSGQKNKGKFHSHRRSQSDDDAYNSYSIERSSNADDTYSNYSLPLDAKSLGMSLGVPMYPTHLQKAGEFDDTNSVVRRETLDEPKTGKKSPSSRTSGRKKEGNDEVIRQAEEASRKWSFASSVNDSSLTHLKQAADCESCTGSDVDVLVQTPTVTGTRLSENSSRDLYFRVY